MGLGSQLKRIGADRQTTATMLPVTSFISRRIISKEMNSTAFMFPINRSWNMNKNIAERAFGDIFIARRTLNHFCKQEFS
jgi:hypothetical protein